MIPLKQIRTKEEFIAGGNVKEVETVYRMDKMYPIRLPYNLWEAAKKCASQNKIPLYRFLLDGIQEKVERNQSKT
jgi:hypothetical protein